VPPVREVLQFRKIIFQVWKVESWWFCNNFYNCIEQFCENIDIISLVFTVLEYTCLRQYYMQYERHVFEDLRNIKSTVFTITAIPAIMDFHFLVMEKSRKISVRKEGSNMWKWCMNSAWCAVSRYWCWFCFCRNGRWRSQWMLTFGPTKGAADLKGLLKVQVWPCTHHLLLFCDVMDFYVCEYVCVFLLNSGQHICVFNYLWLLLNTNLPSCHTRSAAHWHGSISTRTVIGWIMVASTTSFSGRCN